MGLGPDRFYNHRYGLLTPPNSRRKEEPEAERMTAVAWRLPAAAAAQRGFPRPFSTASFNLPQFPSSASPAAPPEPAAEPNTNLFVSGLSKRTTTERLREAFSHFGDVLHARVATDRVTGYSKGFGFVKYATLEDAAKGIEGMHGKFLGGWVIFAEYARPRPPAPQFQINGFPSNRRP